MWSSVKERLRDLRTFSASPNHHHGRHRRCPSSSGSVQHALNIAEIARVVAFHVEDRRTLFALALTNRALSEPALDALWAECNLWHLARLMPSAYWVDKVAVKVDVMGGDRLGKNANWTLRFTDAPREGPWLGDRFLHYSKRVKSIWMRRRDARMQTPVRTYVEEMPPQSWANATVDPDVIVAWTQYAHGPVFPRLIELRVDEVIFRERWDTGVQAPRLAAACALVHAGLRCVSIEMPLALVPHPHGASPTQADVRRLQETPLPLFERVRDVCAGSLHDLRLLGSAQRWLPRIAEAVSPLLAGTSQLTTLVLGGPVSAQNFMHVARLPRLATLQVRGPVEAAFYTSAKAYAGTLFPALEELRMADDALPIPFADVISSRRLRTIIVELWLLPSLESLSHFLSALRNKQALEVLEVARDTTQHVRGAAACRSQSVFGLADLLACVSGLSKLRTLSLASEDDLNPKEDRKAAESALLKYAKEWPHLEQLDIFAGNCKISFDTLRLLLQRCPSLSSLNVGIDLSTGIPLIRIQQRHKHLSFASVIGWSYDVSHVAKFLNDLCPNLVDCRAHTSCSYTDIDMAKQLSIAISDQKKLHVV